MTAHDPESTGPLRCESCPFSAAYLNILFILFSGQLLDRLFSVQMDFQKIDHIPFVISAAVVVPVLELIFDALNRTASVADRQVFALRTHGIVDGICAI